MHTHSHTHTHTHKHAYTCMHKHTHTYMCIHSHTHAHTHTHTHTHHKHMIRMINPETIVFLQYINLPVVQSVFQSDHQLLLQAANYTLMFHYPRAVLCERTVHYHVFVRLSTSYDHPVSDYGLGDDPASNIMTVNSINIFETFLNHIWLSLLKIIHT